MGKGYASRRPLRVLSSALAVLACAAAPPTAMGSPGEERLGSAWLQRALALQYELGADLPLRNAPWIGTHNSFNSIAEMGPALSALDSNQRLTITNQLNQGIRSLELDLHWFPSLRAGGFAPVVCHALDNGVGCTIEKPLEVVLDEIADWLGMRENSDQVLLIYLEDDLDSGIDGYDESVRMLEEAFGELIYRPPPGATCAKLPMSLTRERILRAGARVLLVSGCGPGAWGSVVFDWSEREEERPFGFTDFPDCGGDFSRAAFNGTLVRYYEDSTYLTESTGGADDGISGRTASWMARCGVDLIGLDQLGFPDSRLAGLVWSWATGEPGRGDCAVQRVDDTYPFGRWHSRSCRTERHPACLRQGGGWTVRPRAVSAAAAAAACRTGGARFSVPRTGFEAQRLRLAMRRARVREVWLGYRRTGDGWQPLDVR